MQIKIMKSIQVSIFGMLLACLIPLTVQAEGNTWLVAKDGTGQFDRIADAVMVATDGDTIQIAPGVYEEAIDTGAKELSLIGMDRDHCVLQNDSESYFTPPLNIACGRVENLTIYAYRKKENSTIDVNITPSYLHTGMPGNQKSDFTDYAIHVESPASYGKSLSICHCNLRSDCNHVLGMGVHGNMKVLMEDCILYSGSAGFPIGMHDAEKEGFGTTDVTFKDVMIAAENQCPTMMLLSYHPTINRINLNFQNVQVLFGTSQNISVTNMDGKLGKGWMGTNCFYLAKGSQEGPIYHEQ